MPINPRVINYDIFCSKWSVKFYDTDTQQFFDQEIQPNEVPEYIAQINQLQPSDVWDIRVLPGTTSLRWEKITTPT